MDSDPIDRIVAVVETLHQIGGRRIAGSTRVRIGEVILRDDIDSIDTDHAALRHLRAACLCTRTRPSAEENRDLSGFDLLDDVVFYKHDSKSYAFTRERAAHSRLRFDVGLMCVS